MGGGSRSESPRPVHQRENQRDGHQQEHRQKVSWSRQSTDDAFLASSGDVESIVVCYRGKLVDQVTYSLAFDSRSQEGSSRVRQVVGLGEVALFSCIGQQ